MPGGEVNLCGMKIVESPLVLPVPVLKLRHNTPVTDKFRTEMNQWLLDTFGEKEVFYLLNSDTAVVSPKHAARLRFEFSRTGQTLFPKGIPT